jgi:phage tail-like protein
MMDETRIAVGVRYVVKIDETSLGEFTSCDGLGVEVVLESREEGGNNRFIWQFPTRLKYSNVKLTRPIDDGSSGRILDWIAQVPRVAPSNGHIEVKNAHGDRITGWTLQQVLPVRWSGPALNPDQPKVLTETLEITHCGIKVE